MSVAVCHVCEAPAVGRRCPFCHAELPQVQEPDPQTLLDYLAQAVPGAQAHRGAFERGPVREVTLPGGFTARLHRGALELSPDGPPGAWLDLVLGDARLRARTDFELRRALTRRGWALR